MDKVVIVGVFDFVNFHLCKALLEKGMEVKGITIGNEENEEVLSEKRFEIGRNANFAEVSIGDRANQTSQSETIVLSVYDLYMRYKEDYLLNEHLVKIFRTKSWENIVILAPSQMLINVIDSKAELVIEDFLKRTQFQSKEVYLFYLPTVFGPWQPESFLFQSSILTEMNRGKPFKGLREETGDALYVEDTVKSIIEIIENKAPGRYLLQSGKKNQWDLCAALLQLNDHEVNKSIREIKDADITKEVVPSNVPLSVALTRQIEHAHRLLDDK